MAILVTCTQQKDRDELALKNDRFVFTDFDGAIFEKILAGIECRFPDRYAPEQYIKNLHALADTYGVTKILNTSDYPGCIYTSVFAQERNLLAPSLHAILICQHKYYSRKAQQLYVPEATPDFAIVSKNHLSDVEQISFPLFIKPVKSYLSAFARPVYTMQDLKQYLESVTISKEFFIPFDWAIKNYSDFSFEGSYFIAEKMLTGRQVTLEGYVFEGNVGLIGIVDSVMLPGTISFERFVYPSSLPQEVQEKMFDISARFVAGIGLDMTLFNIEFMYDEATGATYIIEINPRMSAQFSDLFSMVNGVSNYDVLYDIVRRKKPHAQKGGLFKVAASLVCRQKENKRVLHAPTESELQTAQKRFPELKLYPWIKTGDKLSDVLQDGTSYVYCWIHLGAQNQDELETKYAESRNLLPFLFEAV